MSYAGEYREEPVSEPVTLRQRYAMAALPAILAGITIEDRRKFDRMPAREPERLMALAAFNMADAMLAAGRAATDEPTNGR